MKQRIYELIIAVLILLLLSTAFAGACTAEERTAQGSDIIGDGILSSSEEPEESQSPSLISIDKVSEEDTMSTMQVSEGEINAVSNAVSTSIFPTTYSITVGSIGSGFAYSSPPFAVAGTSIRLIANPLPGWNFKGWKVVSGKIKIVNNQFTMPACNVEINAVFEEIPKYTVTVNHTGQGFTFIYPLSAPAGTLINLSASPFSGWVFKEWQVIKGGITVVDNQFIMPAEDVEINAVFEEIPKYTVTVNHTGQGFTFVYPLSAPVGTLINLSASPFSGWVFKEWQVVSGGITVVDNQFVMPACNVEINAVFESLVKYTVTVSSSGHGTVYVSPSSASAGTLITLTAAPKPDYKFKEWQVVSGGVTVENNQFTMPENDVEIIAVFEKILISANKNAAQVEETNAAAISTLTIPQFRNPKSGKSIPLDDDVVVNAVIGGVEQILPAKIVSDKVVLDNPDAAVGASSIIVEFIGKKLGDSDGDGEVTVNDAVKVAQSLVNIVKLNEKGEFYGDADSDGQITVNDAVKVAQRLVDLVDENYE